MPDLTLVARDTWHPLAVRIQEPVQIYLPRFFWIWDRWREATSISCMLFGPFAISSYILATDSHLWWKVLFCSEQCSTSIVTGKGLLWDGEGRKWYLSPHYSSSNFRFNILQYPSSRSSLNSMIWWPRSMTLIKMMMSIVKMRRNKWKGSSENHYTSMPFHRLQMSASKASAG